MRDKLLALVEDYVPRKVNDQGNAVAVREAIGWICRAQDSSGDRGVSHSYLLGKGWMSSYPETTGYIIPTLVNWWRLSRDERIRERALEMAEWESEIQMPSGAVVASVVGRKSPRPAVFNTGQVVFGWISAYRITKDERFLNSAMRASKWILSELTGDSMWHASGSMGADKTHTFNVRTAWAFLHLAKLTEDRNLREAMLRVLEWALRQEQGAGWFASNCLSDDTKPLLHTIAYTARGLLESGIVLDDERFVQAGLRTATALAESVRSNGWMSGRYDQEFRGTTRWSCLTGMAQMSIVWQRFHHLEKTPRFLEKAKAVNAFLRRTQDVASKNPGIRGGIKGSKPVNGSYGKYRVLNWATKFYVDALLFEEHPDDMNGPEYHTG